MGEHVGEDEFRLVDLSFQRSMGGEACFIRRPEEHHQFFADFFARTGDNFERFNYLGEWHSHPGFPAVPSVTDEAQMQAIVDDGLNPPTFAVLIVARLIARAEIQLSATAHRRRCATSPVAVHVSPRPQEDPTRVSRSWWRQVLQPEPTEVRLSCIRVEESMFRDDEMDRNGGSGR